MTEGQPGSNRPPRRDRGSKFDLDLADGRAGEDSLVRAICWARFEAKRDHQAERTGNHAVEYERRRTTGEVEPSGISLTKAEWWAVEIRPDRRWVICHVDDMKQLARRAVRERRHRWGGDGGRSHFALVPLRWLVEVDAASDSGPGPTSR